MVRQPVDLPAITLNSLAGIMSVIAILRQLSAGSVVHVCTQKTVYEAARHEQWVLCWKAVVFALAVPLA